MGEAKKSRKHKFFINIKWLFVPFYLKQFCKYIVLYFQNIFRRNSAVIHMLLVSKLLESLYKRKSKRSD